MENRGADVDWQRLQALWAALSAHLQGLPIPGNWGFCARRPLHSSGGVTVYSATGSERAQAVRERRREAHWAKIEEFDRRVQELE